jgi:hypothetical protein
VGYDATSVSGQGGCRLRLREKSNDMNCIEKYKGGAGNGNIVLIA